MCKKIFIVAVAAVVGMWAWHKTDLGHYFSLAWDKAKASANKQIPLEDKIAFLKKEVAKLTPDMRSQIDQLAREQHEVDKLAKDIEASKDSLAKQEESLQTRFTSLGNRAADEKLTRDWDNFNRAKAQFETKKDTLAAMQEALDADMKKIDEIRARKEQMELKIQKLEADLKALRVAQTRCESHVDDSQVSRCQQTLNELEDEIDIANKELSLESKFTADGTLKAKTDTSKTKAQMETYFKSKVDTVTSNGN
jgi:peptidoglycan hydrolase CwlO-like protein